MSIAIRPADLEADRELLINAVRYHLNPLADGRRFDWLYRDNPHGSARAWIAVDTTNSTVIGTAAAFPRRIYGAGSETLAWVLGDFCINGQYRSLGPALQLQRACIAAALSRAVPYYYDFPSPKMIAIYRRLHIDVNFCMIRLAKPLRVDRKVEAIVKVPALARRLSAVGNLLLTWHDRCTMAPAPALLSLHEGQCGEEFSILAKTLGSHYGVCVQRSAAYLNWRYLANPLGRYEIFTARRDKKLLGYAVFTQAGRDAFIVDLLTIDEPAIVGSLVDNLIITLRQRGVITLSTSLLASHRWISLLQRHGFKIREASPVIIFGAPYPYTNGDALNSVSWFLMPGDRDS